MGYLGEPSVTTRILRSGGGEVGIKSQRELWLQTERNAALLALKMGEGIQELRKAGGLLERSKEMNSPPESPERKEALPVS